MNNTGGNIQLRQNSQVQSSPSGETSSAILNSLDCKALVADPIWKQRGEAAYMGVNRTDPDAIWSFQGFDTYTIYGINFHQ